MNAKEIWELMVLIKIIIEIKQKQLGPNWVLMLFQILNS